MIWWPIWWIWNYQAAFLLGAENQPVSGKNTRKYIFEDENFGRSDGQSFAIEFLPLPKSDVNGIGPYSHIWPTYQAYLQDVIPGRVELLTETLEDNQNVDWIVVYGQNNRAAQLLRSEYESDQKDTWQGLEHSRPFARYELTVSDNRSVQLIHAPFFGQGRTSYENVAEAAQFFHDAVETEEL